MGSDKPMITSKDNQQIKYIHKLKQKKYRDQKNKFLIFGDHLIEEAKKANIKLEIYTSNPKKEGTLISHELMKYLSFLDSPQDILAIVEKQPQKPYTNKILILEDVQDPDNVGALIRSAVGFGFETVISSLKSADFYNEKTIRTSQGTLFHANLIRKNVIEEITQLKHLNYKIIVTSPHTNKDIKSLKVKDKVVLVLGNEGSGISDEVFHLADEVVKITTTTIESLNVSVAGAIAMFVL